MTTLYEETNALGINTKIHYVATDINNCMSPTVLNTYMDDIHDNTYPYMGNMFQGLDLDIWDYDAPDIPFDTFDGSGNRLTYGVGNWGGLTWYTIDEMDISDSGAAANGLGRNQYMGDVLSHETGHLFAYKMGFNDEANPLRAEWYRIRGTPEQATITALELIAEDFRLLFGCEGVKNLVRGAHTSALTVRGLLGFYKIWKMATEWIKQFKTHATIEGLAFEYSQSDFDYASVYWFVNYTNPAQQWLNRWYRISNTGIEHSDSNNVWQPFRTF